MADQVRLEKDIARKFVVEFAPQYAELLRDFQRQGKWLRLPDQLLTIRENLKIHNYVELYSDEKHLDCFLFLALLGEDGFQKFHTELSGLSFEEQVASLHEWFREARQLDVGNLFPPDTEEARQEAQREFEQLSEARKKEVTRQAQFFGSFLFAHFFNVISLMVHGAKLTTLVPQAIAGDEEAFGKAIQIDRLLSAHHPYFRQRRLDALERGETEFINEIAYRERNPTLRGKIRYPGIYMVFACLEAAQWLNDFTHEEILDVCDEAGLDRYPNRIEDVNYLTKRLQAYRRMQKRGSLSTQ